MRRIGVMPTRKKPAALAIAQRLEAQAKERAEALFSAKQQGLCIKCRQT